MSSRKGRAEHEGFATYPEFHPQHPRMCVRTFRGPGLFITATGSDVGKTVVTAALAGALHRMHVRVGLCKPVASGCEKLANGELSAPDTAMAARAAGLDPEDGRLLEYMAPIRYEASVSPWMAAQLEGRAPDWRRVASALDWWQENCSVLLVEGAGGWYVPLDQHDFMMADLAAGLRLPVIVVTNAALGTLNQTLLTVHAIRQRGLAVAGLVINRVHDEGKRDVAARTNLTELPRLTGVPVRAVLPELGDEVIGETVPERFVELMAPFAQEWWGMVRGA